MVDGLGDFFAWVLEAPLTVEQRETVRQGLIELWQSGAKADIDPMVQALRAQAEVRKHPAAERDLIREQVQPELLAELRKQPDNEAAKWLLGIYGSAHTPIAAGDPPLTRQVADAYAEVLLFMISQVLGNGLQANAEVKDQFAKALVNDYPNYDPAARKELANMPKYWAAIRIAWPTLPADQQETYRKQWAPGVAALLKPSATAAPPKAGPPGEGELPLESQDAKGYLLRAGKYYEQGDWRAVIADCDRAVQLDARCAAAYLLCARAHAAEFESKDVIACATRAIELDPKCWEAYEVRGGAYYPDQAEKAEADWAKMRQLKQAQGVEAPEATSTGDARLDAMRKLQEHQETMRWMSDMQRLSHETSMAIISNIGGGGWTYEYQYR